MGLTGSLAAVAAAAAVVVATAAAGPGRRHHDVCHVLQQRHAQRLYSILYGEQQQDDS